MALLRLRLLGLEGDTVLNDNNTVAVATTTRMGCRKGTQLPMPQVPHPAQTADPFDGT